MGLGSPPCSDLTQQICRPAPPLLCRSPPGPCMVRWPIGRKRTDKRKSPSEDTSAAEKTEEAPQKEWQRGQGRDLEQKSSLQLSLSLGFRGLVLTQPCKKTRRSMRLVTESLAGAAAVLPVDIHWLNPWNHDYHPPPTEEQRHALITCPGPYTICSVIQTLSAWCVVLALV